MKTINCLSDDVKATLDEDCDILTAAAGLHQLNEFDWSWQGLHWQNGQANEREDKETRERYMSCSY